MTRIDFLNVWFILPFSYLNHPGQYVVVRRYLVEGNKRQRV